MNREIFRERFKALMSIGNGVTKTTQEKLAQYLGVQRVMIFYYVNGNQFPTAERIAQIAEFFEVSTDYLLGLTNNPNPPDKIEPAPPKLMTTAGTWYEVVRKGTGGKPEETVYFTKREALSAARKCEEDAYVMMCTTTRTLESNGDVVCETEHRVRV